MQRNPPTAANDNNQRPAAFDAAVMRHMPALRALSRKYVPAGKRADVIQDVLTRIFANWTNYRGDNYGTGSGFYSWLRWQFRGVLSGHKNKNSPTIVYTDTYDKYEHMVSAPADQERALVARDIIDRAQGRNGGVLLKRAMGFGLKELGEEMGITKERVRQLEEAGRARLAEVADGERVAA